MCHHNDGRIGLFCHGIQDAQYSVFAPENRITKSSWFIDEHDKVKADVWKRDGIKSPANCLACHTDGANGGFKEKNIRIPAK
jgi:hypothetical protein